MSAFLRAIGWTLLAAGCGVHLLILTPAASLGKWVGLLAQRLDVRLDRWRYVLQRNDERVRLQVDKVAYAIQHGATEGFCHYDWLEARDMDRLARAIDNYGCYVRVEPRRLEWRRRDRYPTGEPLGLHALAPADRDAWADAIANLDGEGER